MRHWQLPQLPTVPDGPLGCFSLLAINYGVAIDKLSPHTKAAASVIFHRYANLIFSRRQLREIVAIASKSRPTRRQLRKLDRIAMKLARAELQIGRSLDG